MFEEFNYDLHLWRNEAITIKKGKIFNISLNIVHLFFLWSIIPTCTIHCVNLMVLLYLALNLKIFFKKCLEKFIFSFFFNKTWSKNTGVDVKWIGLFLRKKSSFKMLGWLSLLIGLGLLHISIAKTASKKIEALIHSMKILSPKVALYLYKSTIQPCMGYCCHV